jgi:hypothetical protein
MRSQLVLVFCLVAGFQGLAQTAAAPAQGLPKDPRAILAAAAPFYDFSDAALKPWHLKASYQLYDDKGNAAEQGTFEYWWASPKVYRSTWTRPSVTHTDWYTADGKHAYLSSGEGLSYFESQLQSAFLSPLPDAGDLDATKVRLDREELKVGNAKLPCVMVVPLMPQHGQLQVIPLGLFPTYCFDPIVPALRIKYSFGTITEGFEAIVEVQGRFLPKELAFFDGRREILSAKMESVAGLSPADPALVPDSHAKFPGIDKVPVSNTVAVGLLFKKVTPIYPQDAKDARVSGKVVLGAIIGRDGRVHELHVIEAPWPSLVASAVWAVSQWEYKPYLLNGEPVEVETIVNVTYTLGP